MKVTILEQVGTQYRLLIHAPWRSKPNKAGHETKEAVRGKGEQTDSQYEAGLTPGTVPVEDKTKVQTGDWMEITTVVPIHADLEDDVALAAEVEALAQEAVNNYIARKEREVTIYGKVFDFTK